MIIANVLKLSKALTMMMLNNYVELNDTWTHWKAFMMTCSMYSPSAYVLFSATFSVLLVATTGWNNYDAFIL